MESQQTSAILDSTECNNSPGAPVVPQKLVKEELKQYESDSHHGCASYSDDCDVDPDYTVTVTQSDTKSISKFDSRGDEWISGKKNFEVSLPKPVTSTAVMLTSKVTEANSPNYERNDANAFDVMPGYSDGNEHVAVTVAQSSGKRSFDKKPYCYYCGVPQAQIQRHWFSKHACEKEVIDIDICRDKIRRMQLIGRLRNIGNHFHNAEVIQKGEGEILVTYRKSGTAKASEYVPCELCYSYLKKTELCRHRCKFGKTEKATG